MLAEKEILSIVGSRKLISLPLLHLAQEQLLSKIKEIKRLGYVVSMRERDLDTGGIAAPVFTHKAWSEASRS